MCLTQCQNMLKKLVDTTLEIPTLCIPSLAIAIEIYEHSKRLTYGPWPVVRPNTILQKGLITNADRDCLTMDNMKLFRQQYVIELQANKFYW